MRPEVAVEDVAAACEVAGEVFGELAEEEIAAAMELDEELKAGDVEANEKVYTADEESEEDVAPQRVAVDPGQPTLEEVEETKLCFSSQRNG